MAPKTSSLESDRPSSPPPDDKKTNLELVGEKFCRTIIASRSETTSCKEAMLRGTAAAGSTSTVRRGSRRENNAQNAPESPIRREAFCHCPEDVRGELCTSAKRFSQSSQLFETRSRRSSGRNSLGSLYGRVALEDYELLELDAGLGSVSSESDTHVEISAISCESVNIAAVRAAHRRSNSQAREAVCELSPTLSLSFFTRRDTRSPLPLPPLPSSSADGEPEQPRKAHIRRQSSASSSFSSSSDELPFPPTGPSKLSRDLAELDAVGWYWGPLCRKDAEKKLAGKAEGTFLLRDSSDTRHLFALSVRVGEKQTRHYLVRHSNEGYSWYDRSSRTSEVWGLTGRQAQTVKTSLVDLVNCTVQASKRPEQREKTAVFLLHPLSRFSPVPSLQHFARFVVRRRSGLTIDNVDRLPVPTSLKAYLKEPAVH